MKSVSCSKPGYSSITWSKISNIPYNLIFATKQTRLYRITCSKISNIPEITLV
jgi:hypothetical protein